MQVTTFYGIDFIGAVKAGRKIWIAEGTADGDALRINSCIRACDLPGSGRDRAHCLAALRKFIGRPGNFSYGLDFPFGLPGVLVEQASWKAFVLNFGAQFGSPIAFREACTNLAIQKTGLKEFKRVTDIEAKTPFSPYNIRLFRQTFYGMRDVLAPLVADERIRVLPMQEPKPGLPIVIEICPASTLKGMGRIESYKKASLSLVRERILDELARQTAISIPDDVKCQVVEDGEGDALDSIVAATATYRAMKRPNNEADKAESHLLEGCVYV